jgi:hypothetical protein
MIGPPDATTYTNESLCPPKKRSETIHWCMFINSLRMGYASRFWSYYKGSASGNCVPPAVFGDGHLGITIMF